MKSRNRLNIKVGKLVEGSADGPFAIIALVAIVAGVILARAFGFI